MIILFIVSPILYYLIVPAYDDYDGNLTSRTLHLRVGTFRNTEYWDPVISDGINILCSYYSANCIESLFYFSEDSIDPKSSLATSWEIEYWLEENNSRGFINRGGVKAINITLREGVEFHDGSSWNATVAKWNIDRIYVITGNLTGNAAYLDLRKKAYFWVEVESVKPFFTANWNLTEYDADGITFTSDQYAEYDIDDNVTISNPNPYGGWDPIRMSHIHYSPYDMYPIIKQVKLSEDKQSGGKIRVEFNDWNSEGFTNLLLPMISMQTYKDYFDRGIYGYQNGIQDPNNPTIIDHMVGTGPYKFVEHTEIHTGGYMIKNVNYWNRSSLEAEGWFELDKITVVYIPPGNLGRDALNTAIMTHSFDYVIDENPYYPLDYNAILSNPGIYYANLGVTNYITQITLNCINETWWSWGSPYNYRNNISSLYSDQGSPSGIPRALRKAISFAFDYDSYISTNLDGCIIRTGSIMGLKNVFYNSSVPITNYNLTKAREILLTTEDDPYTYTYNQNFYNFSMLCSTRGLMTNSGNIEWQDIAESNPIFTINFYWDNTHEDLKNVFQNSLKNIGIKLNVIGNTNGIPSQIPPHFTTFDGNHSIWSSHSWSWDFYMPTTFSDFSVTLSFGDPNYGSWRVDPWAPSTDPSFSWWSRSNFAFCYDEDIDNWLDRMTFSNNSGKLKWLSKISNKIQNEIYPTIFISQGKKALALWKDWDMNFNRGILFFANFRYLSCSSCLQHNDITGYNVYLLIGFIAISSIIIVLKKMKFISKRFIFH